MDNKKISIGTVGAMKWIYSYIKVYKGWFLTSLIATAALIAINLYKAYFTQQLLSVALEGTNDELVNMIMTFGVIIIMGMVLNYTSKLAIGKFSIYAIRDMKNKLAQHVSGATIASLNEVSTGDLASRLNNDSEMIANFIKNNLTSFTVQLLMGLVAAVYIYFLSWKLLLVCFAAIPLAMLFANYLNKKAALYYPESYKRMGEASGEIEEYINGIDMIKVYSLKDEFGSKTRDIFNGVFRAEMMTQRYVSILTPVCFFLSNFPRLLCILYGGFLVTRGELKIGTVIATLQLFEYMAIPSVLLPFFLNQMNRGIAAIDRIQQVMDMPLESSGGEDIKECPQLQTVKVENVSFGYDESQKVLRGISFELKKCQMTAMVGISGSGKSTIINLISGLYKTQGGSIKIYGKDINTISLKSLRQMISVVSQDTYLFPTTIRENILYGNPLANHGEVEEAAKAAYIHEFIEGLPEGYNTIVGDGGVGLSGGQRQRISIARGILKNAPIILLDEPTSALDNQNEWQIQKSIERLIEGRTVLVIAHRLTTIEKADHIIVLDNGGVIESGSHQDLIDKKDFYYRLYRNQISA